MWMVETASREQASVQYSWEWEEGTAKLCEGIGSRREMARRAAAFGCGGPNSL